MEPSERNHLHQPSAPPILPLPSEAIAKIKSSVAIKDLIDVVIGLVKNSLDARASKIDVCFDFGRGNAIIEDNGIGIAAHEFGQDGGLFKLYWTSKAESPDVHGLQGTFLAAVATLSLITISSRQIDRRSLNTIVFHYSKETARYTPAPPHHNLTLGEFGTRVSVRNLFGNLPVRVKQRSLLDEYSEADRCWKNVKTEMVALLLAWSNPISLTLRDERTGTKLVIREVSNPKKRQVNVQRQARLSGFGLECILGILTQSSFILPGSWTSWIPVTGSTPSVSIKGAISLDAAASKQCQFISLGVQPLSKGQSHNELYDEINRIVSSSRFGVIDEYGDFSEAERERRKKDGRYKQEQGQFTDKSVRKGVDRWSMFYLRITLKDNCKMNLEDSNLDDRANLETVLEVMGAIVTQWLVEHHFMQKQSKRKRKPSQERMKDVGKEIFMPHRLEILDRLQSEDNVRKVAMRSDSNKGEESGLLVELDQSGRLNDRLAAFGTWSRIKTSGDNFYRKGSASLQSASLQSASLQSASLQTGYSEAGGSVPGPIDRNLGDNTSLRDFSNAAFRGLDKTSICPSEQSFGCTLNENGNVGSKNTITEQSTGSNSIERPSQLTNASLVDKSTDLTPSHDCDLIQEDSTEQSELKYRLKHGSQAMERFQSTDWLGSFLDRWKNPVFHNSEANIQRACYIEEASSLHWRCHSRNEQSGSIDSLLISNNLAPVKLSVAGLKKAKVIAQLDGKFILVKISTSYGNEMSVTMIDPTANTILVIIDQHAADERCRVERLFEELFEGINSPSDKTLVSNLGQTALLKSIKLRIPIVFQVPANECALLKRHAAYFARWGILYDISMPSAFEKGSGKIRTLPSAISERCIADPKLAIDLLRAESWKREENPNHDISPATNNNGPHPWLQGLSSSPGKIIDMLNSRACRSSIMFNDHLKVEECQDLVMRLSKCAFPFQCAHGRPSLVPLVSLGEISMGARDESASTEVADLGFAKAYRRWKHG